MKITSLDFGLLEQAFGGSGEIRTHERDKPSLVFKTSAFNHSATLPFGITTDE
jgi:hypothetical protein